VLDLANEEKRLDLQLDTAKELELETLRELEQLIEA